MQTTNNIINKSALNTINLTYEKVTEAWFFKGPLPEG
jgi:hypothetical protein